jgi:tRNA(His) 5'-end guanylyltransferase
MTQTLRERQEDHEVPTDFVLLKKIPVIIRITIKNYKRIAPGLKRPYCVQFSDIMSQTMLYILTSIQDAVFGYCHNDEITLVLRNDLEHDQVPWCNNNLQKMVGTVASLATLGFYRSKDLFANELELGADALFDVKVFNVPKVYEAVNNIILRQSYCMKQAINDASLYLLEEKFGRAHAVHLLKDKSYDDKQKMLLRHFGIDFLDYYPGSFLRGIAVYKKPTLVPTRSGSTNRNKWYIDDDIPNFVEDKDFVFNIINTGSDVFRASDILENINKD